ncbi:MAG: hypothetical protein JO317_01940, partial [Verrucomicrobiae bacterium]|nr:hypothetical protein [Verrucomicrobiae bacterium]
GQLGPNDYIFREGLANWELVSQHPEFGGAAVVGAAPVPPMPIATSGAGAGELSVGAIYTEAWGLFKEHMVPFIIVSVLFAALTMGVGFVMGFVLGPRGQILTNIYSLIVTGPLQLGIWTVCLNAVDRRPVEFAQIFDGFKRFLPAFLTYLLILVLVFAGLLALIIGAFIVGIFVSLSWGFAADGHSPIDAVKGSFESVKTNFGTILVLCLLAIPIAFAGLICLVVGIFPAMIFWTLTMAVAYRWMNPATPAIA